MTPRAVLERLRSSLMNWRRLRSSMGSAPEPALVSLPRARDARWRPQVLGARWTDQVMGFPDDHSLSPARRARCGGGLGPARSPRISSNISDNDDLVEFTLLKPMSAGVD